MRPVSLSLLAAVFFLTTNGAHAGKTAAPAYRTAEQAAQASAASYLNKSRAARQALGTVTAKQLVTRGVKPNADGTKKFEIGTAATLLPNGQGMPVATITVQVRQASDGKWIDATGTAQPVFHKIY